MAEHPTPPWYDPQTASSYSGWSLEYIRRACRDGSLKAHQANPRARWRIHQDDLDAWLSGTRHTTVIPTVTRIRRAS